jgi:dihydrofolate reductase
LKIGVIFACDPDGGIGFKNKIPWHIPLDFSQFKDATMGKPMIMGRKTFDSLPGILPGREHMVITSSPQTLPEHDSVYSAWNLKDALRQFDGDTEMVWVIGGKSLIEEAIHIADIVRLTKVFKMYEHDVSISVDALTHIHKRSVFSEQIITAADHAVIEFHMKERPPQKGMLLN